MLFKNAHAALESNCNLPILVGGLVLWPVAVYAIHLICHAYGILWQ